jgi:hypothetical protein
LLEISEECHQIGVITGRGLPIMNYAKMIWCRIKSNSDNLLGSRMQRSPLSCRIVSTTVEIMIGGCGGFFIVLEVGYIFSSSQVNIIQIS